MPTPASTRIKAAALLLGMAALPGCLPLTLLPDTGRIAPLTPGQCAQLQAQGVMRAEAPLPCSRLRAVTVRHFDFAGATQQGSIVVLDAAAANVAAIFETLHARRFPLHKVTPMEHYGGDDRAAMQDNNSSAFNARPLTGESRWSMHAYGAAIDINPRQNPYIGLGSDGLASVLPPSAAPHALNRLNERPGKPHRPGLAEEVVEVFAENGFVQWGGYWDAPIDYQHFEIGTRRFTEQLAEATPAQAQQLFDAHVRAYRRCRAAQVGAAPATARAVCVAKLLQP